MKSTLIESFTSPLACTTAPLTHSLALHCSLHLRSIARSRSPALMGKKNMYLIRMRRFHVVFTQSPLALGVMATPKREEIDESEQRTRISFRSAWAELLLDNVL